MSVRPSRLSILAALTILVGSASAASAETFVTSTADERVGRIGGAWSFHWENDFLRTDRYYTNGLRFQVLMPWVDHGDDPVDSLLAEFWPRGDLRTPKYAWFDGWSVGQLMYTPDDIVKSELQPKDRRYGGWAYVGRIAEAVSVVPAPLPWKDDQVSEVADRVELDVGVLGPSSLAGPAQTLWHQIIQIPPANGWMHQLPDRPIMNLVLDRTVRLPIVAMKGITLADAGYFYGGALGNAFTMGQVGGLVRVGFIDDFMHPLMHGAMFPTVALTDDSGKVEAEQSKPAYPRNKYLFAGASGRLVGWNAFLEGVSTHPVVMDREVGVSFEAWGPRIILRNIWRTGEFSGGQPQEFSTLSVVGDF